MSQLDLADLSSSKSHSFPKSYVPKDLETCKYVWLRVERVRRALEAPYTGLYEVLSRTSKQYTIKISDDIHKNVSVDRLKRAVFSPCPKFLETKPDCTKNVTNAE